MSDQPNWDRLLRRIKDRRRSVDAYLRSARPRAERLTYVSVISSALAAVLTAGPALGGTDFTKRAGKALEVDPTSVWQTLCMLAMVVSVIAAISANLSKSKNAEGRIVAAEASSAELEGLQALVEFQQVPFEEAVKLYQHYVATIPFVAETTGKKHAVRPPR